MKQKIQTLIADMNTGLIDRQHALKAALLTVLASENMVLIGPPGTAKSMLARRVAQHIQTSNGAHPSGDGTSSYFEYLLTKFSTPKEVGVTVQLTQRDFEEIDAAAQQVVISPAVGQAIRDIWVAHKEAFKDDQREHLSDQCLEKLFKLLRVSAATNHRTEVDLSDAMLLQHCLWSHPDNMSKVREIVTATLQQHSPKVPIEIDDAASANAAAYVLGSDGTRFMGSGTAQDPIRIGNAEDLVGMSDPVIGRAGYHFVQTCDIDCTQITDWPTFRFTGHYHGGRKTIQNLPDLNACIFATLDNASVSYLRLAKCSLAKTVYASKIMHCQTIGGYLVLENTAANTELLNCQATDTWLIKGSTSKTKITRCQVTNGHLVAIHAETTQIVDCQVIGGWLIVGNASTTQITGCQVTRGGLVGGGNTTNTDISRCQVIDGWSLVGDVFNTRISDCAVMMQWETKNNYQYMGCIARTLAKGSIVERCFSMGTYKNTDCDMGFGGIVGQCAEYSTVRQCSIGALSVKLRNPNRFNRIVGNPSCATLENNAAIDTVVGTSQASGLDGKTVIATRFNQRFFEGSLGWDFDTVWQWDAIYNRPTIRFGAGNDYPAPTSIALQDLLTRQVQSNIWF